MKDKIKQSRLYISMLSGNDLGVNTSDNGSLLFTKERIVVAVTHLTDPRIEFLQHSPGVTSVSGYSAYDWMHGVHLT